MTSKVIVGSAIAALLCAAVGGYRLGAGAWPGFRASGTGRTAVAVAVAPVETSSTKRTVLYWKDPDGKPDFSPEPKKTTDGRVYLPVYEDQEAGFAGAHPAKPANSGKILYYRNPMGLADTSPVPKKDWMGMDYIAVREGEDEPGSTVKISLDRVQRSGVRTGKAEMRKLARPVRAPGVAKPDERTMRVITLRADGFIEKLYVNETGRHVKAGEPLFRVYIPQLVAIQSDYRTAATWSGKEQRDEKGPLQRLKNLDVPDSVLQLLKTSPNPLLSVDWPAPVSGVVMQKKVIEGQMVKAGEEMFRLADLANIWVIADVTEQDVAMVEVGAPARIAFRAFPGETFQGRVTFVLHELEMATRTGKVRIEVANPEHRIKHEMFADVEIDAGANEAPRLVVAASAEIDSGNRQVVLVDRGEGRFEPRAVKLGMRGDGWIEVREGLAAGETVVEAANFLIDAESNLKAALRAFTAEPAPEGKR